MSVAGLKLSVSGSAIRPLLIVSESAILPVAGLDLSVSRSGISRTFCFNENRNVVLDSLQRAAN